MERREAQCDMLNSVVTKAKEIIGPKKSP